MSYRVADLVADALLLHGVDRAFSVPGESFLPLLDALHDRPAIDLVTCRHEGSASLAAIADAKLTGRPAVVMVSRGPGAFNGALGLHVAAQEAIPIIMLVGQVDLRNLGRGGVQEFDAARTFAGSIKWAGRIDSPERAAETMARAFTVAVSGTPGAVIVELPEDILSLRAGSQRARRHGVSKAMPTQHAVDTAAQLLHRAEKPILIVGGECRTPQFRADLLQLSERSAVPVVATNKNQDQFPNRHDHWIGQLGIFYSAAHARLFEQADLFVAVGTRMGDLASLGFNYPRQGPHAQKLVHVYPDPDAIGRHFETTLGVVSSAHPFVAALLARVNSRNTNERWLEEVRTTREASQGWTAEHVPVADVLGHAVQAIADELPDDAIITTDSGNFAAWVHRIVRLTTSHRLLGSQCGAMGTGVPSGISACLRHPRRKVVAFCGDGGFLMTGNELITAVERKLDLTVVVSNNNSYGTIRSHQQKTFPARVSGTNLSNPNFAALAEAFGCPGYTISAAHEASAVVREVMQRPGPAIVNVCCDADQTLDKSICRSGMPEPSRIKGLTL